MHIYLNPGMYTHFALRTRELVRWKRKLGVFMSFLGLIPKLKVIRHELPIRYRALNWGCHMGISRQARGFHLMWLRHERQKQDNVRSDQARLLTRKKREESAYAMLILSGHDH